MASSKLGVSGRIGSDSKKNMNLCVGCGAVVGYHVNKCLCGSSVTGNFPINPDGSPDWVYINRFMPEAAPAIGKFLK